MPLLNLLKVRYTMTKHNKSDTFLIKLCKKVDDILVNDKARNETIQEVLTAFIDNYNTTLAQNSTPLSKLLHGLKKTDATLVKMYVETVTNAKIGLNDKNKLVIKLKKDEQLETNEAYTTLTWYDLAKDTKTIRKDHYDNLEQAVRAYKKWFEKAILTTTTQEDYKTLESMLEEARAEVFEKIKDKSE